MSKPLIEQVMDQYREALGHLGETYLRHFAGAKISHAFREAQNPDPMYFHVTLEGSILATSSPMDLDLASRDTWGAINFPTREEALEIWERYGKPAKEAREQCN